LKVASFAIADIATEPGELKFGRLPVGEMRDGSIASIPLMVMHGVQDGPILWVDAAIHGDEIPGIEVIRRIMREEVTPSDLHGIIVAAPVLNPFAFQVGQSHTPFHGGIGNRDAHAVFPGDPMGPLSDRLAHRIFNQGILKCDYYINFHSNHYPAVEFIPLTLCEDRQVLDASLAWAEAIGLPLSEVRGATGWPIYNAQKEGKPALVIELLAQGYLDRRSINIGVLAMLNALRHLGMLPGDVEPLQDLRVPPGRFGRGFVLANRAGLVHFLKDAGNWIATGETLAIIRNVYGDICEEVTAPMQGYIRTLLFGPHNEAVHEGGVIASVLEADPDRTYFA
jgi:uncharacterized protein